MDALLNLNAGRVEKTTGQLLQSNGTAARFGLSLSGEEAKALALRQRELLGETGRIEFGEGIVGRLAFAFCDSPYIAPQSWGQTLAELLECFYHYKNEIELPDDELLAFMKEHFDGDCAGSVEYLSGTLLEGLSQRLRTGGEDEPEEERPEEGEDDD